MQLGRHLRELSRLRLGLAISVVLAILAGLWSVDKISLSPLGLKPRSLQMAAASTRALVDAPKSSILDQSVNVYDLQSLTNRALLIGNVMASPPVHGDIARRAGVPSARLKVLAPITVDFPRQLSTDIHPKGTDILESPEQYRISIQVNPTVPVIDIYTQAPTTAEANRLATGAILGMQDYLRALGRSQHVKPSLQVRLVQLGAPRGGLLNRGVAVEGRALVVGACVPDLVRRGRRDLPHAPRVGRGRPRRCARAERLIEVADGDRQRPASPLASRSARGARVA